MDEHQRVVALVLRGSDTAHCTSHPRLVCQDESLDPHTQQKRIPRLQHDAAATRRGARSACSRGERAVFFHRLIGPTGNDGASDRPQAENRQLANRRPLARAPRNVCVGNHTKRHTRSVFFASRCPPLLLPATCGPKSLANRSERRAHRFLCDTLLNRLNYRRRPLTNRKQLDLHEWHT
jgi:hypothetical protein